MLRVARKQGWLKRVEQRREWQRRGEEKIAERGQKGLSLGDKEITRRAVSVVFALTVNPFSSQTEYTSLSASRVGSDLERGTERLARGLELTAISTRVDPRFPKPAIVAMERERRCAEGYLSVDGDGSRNDYVLSESGISSARSFHFVSFRFVSFRFVSFITV